MTSNPPTVRAPNRKRTVVRVSANPQRCPLCGRTDFAASPLDAEALLEAIAVYIGPATFNTSDLVKHAEAKGGLLQLVIGGRSTRQLGKALQKISTVRQFGGLFIERQGRDKSGTLWRIRFPREM